MVNNNRVSAIIANLIARGVKISVIETGVPCEVLHGLMSTKGISKILTKGYVPYAKDSNRPFKRVSEGYVRELVKGDDSNAPTIFASSVQLKDETDSGVSHGWICIKYSALNYRFHFTLPKASREDTIAMYKDLAFSCIQMACTKPYTDFSHIPYLDTSSHFGTESYINVNEIDNRLEVYRDYKSIDIYKGSFNPKHEAHEAIIDSFGSPVILISANHYAEKPSRTKSDLLNCAKQFPRAIISTHADSSFLADSRRIAERLPNVKLNFIVGDDVLQQIESDPDFDPTQFSCTFSVIQRVLNHEDLRELIELSGLKILKIVSFGEELRSISSTEIRTTQEAQVCKD